MLSQYLIDFLPENGGQMAGTRDANNVPVGTRVTGMRASEDGTTITFYVLVPFVKNMVDNLLDNGRVAVTIAGEGNVNRHEGYQFKGTYLSHEGPNEATNAFSKQWFVRTADEMKDQGYPDEVADMMRSYPHLDTIAVTFRVEEIFSQTPGPGAGNRWESKS